jgi:prepilin-type N-terminal cleavage/methylation domain-containing protein
LVLGFTLIEIIITVAITALLAGTLITYNATGRAQVALSVERAKLVQVILRAKSLTIGTFGNGSVCGYGVRIDSASQYTLFSCSAADCETVFGVGSCGVSDVTTYSVERGVVIGSGSIGGSVLFVAPDPRTMTMGGGTIALLTADGRSSAQVTISSGGQVSY